MKALHFIEPCHQALAFILYQATPLSLYRIVVQEKGTPSIVTCEMISEVQRFILVLLPLQAALSLSLPHLLALPFVFTNSKHNLLVVTKLPLAGTVLG